MSDDGNKKRLVSYLFTYTHIKLRYNKYFCQPVDLNRDLESPVSNDWGPDPKV